MEDPKKPIQSELDGVEEAWESVMDCVECMRDDLKWPNKDIARMLRSIADTVHREEKN